LTRLVRQQQSQKGQADGLADHLAHGMLVVLTGQVKEADYLTQEQKGQADGRVKEADYLTQEQKGQADVLVLVLMGRLVGGLTLADQTHPSVVDGAPCGRSCARCQRGRSRCRLDRRSPRRRRSMDEEADHLEGYWTVSGTPNRSAHRVSQLTPGC
jgi:hypothetical protein